MISKSETVVEGDQSVYTQTKVFTRLVFSCRNPSCSQYQKEVGEVKHQIYPENN
nr:MAG TPA: hypothetical protein [Caudoviricetes sp.]